jgi:hypothetical protein
MTRQLLQQAHAALDTCESMTGYYHDERAVSAAMVAITAALAQPEPELTECRHCGFYVALNQAPAPTGDKS